MDLLSRIINCSDEEVDLIIKEAIEKANNNATKIGMLGYIEHNKSNNLFKGFIPLDTRIKYNNYTIENYGMETTDFMYEFAYFIRKYNINNKFSLIFNLECFINNYFGLPGKVDREEIFNDKAWNSTTTDEEYFKAIENNKLGDLKGMGAAECTERGALAQQILSLFDTEVYYVVGCVDLETKQEAHCYNIIKRKEDYAVLDYSIPVVSYSDDGNIRAYYPFLGSLSNEDFEEFVNNGKVKSFNNYYMFKNKVVKLDDIRKYVVGDKKIEKDDIKLR